MNYRFDKLNIGVQVVLCLKTQSIKNVNEEAKYLDSNLKIFPLKYFIKII